MATNTFGQDVAQASGSIVPTALPPAPIPVIPTSITSAALTPTPTVPFQQPVPTPVYNPASIVTPPLAATPTENQATELTKTLQDFNNQTIGESAYRTTQETAQDVAGKTQTVNDLTNKFNTLKNEANAIPLQLQQNSEGRGITTGGLAPIQEGALRNNAIESLTTGALLQAAQGNLTTALSLVDRAVAQKFDPIKEQIAANTANLQLILNSPQYSDEQKNRAQAQLDAQNAQKAAIDKQAQAEADKQKVAINAAGNIQNFTPTAQYPTAATALDAMGKATSAVEAEQIAAATGLSQPVSKTASIQEYEYAKANGYTGSYTQYQNEDANRKLGIVGGTFSSTQVNKGASNAGLSAQDFNALPTGVQNLFINNNDVATLLVNSVKGVMDGSVQRNDALDDINNSNVSQDVKEYFISHLPAAPVNNDGTSGGGFLGWLGSFFNG